MIYLYILLLLFICSFASAQEQGFAINIDGTAPDANAIIDVKSINQVYYGFYILK